MMETDKLRKADIFSGGIIFLLGVWIVSQALKMPMKDSWGGVQNVWYVSPALFPLFVGAMISLLGALLIRKALKTVGLAGITAVITWLTSRELTAFLRTGAMMRFYTIVTLFASFVFIQIPRVDFFLSAVLFLLVFITTFYFDVASLLKKLLYFYLAGTLIMLLLFATGLMAAWTGILPFAADWLTLVFILTYAAYARRQVAGDAPLSRKFRLSLILAISAPFFIGSIFKFLLLVPMPTEGLVTIALDTLWYSIF
ncbi:MAG: hypothetical protein QNJ22_16470 [Desulfosarcinaceae bacterium]|nr:hypothetical protein [Desulfosarcinaceae bacterium]